MPSYVNINGRLVEANEAVITPGSRAFRYGYGLFETMVVQEGHIRLKQYHWERLEDGMSALQIFASKHFFNELEDSLLRTISRNGCEDFGRVRLQVWPSSGGYYDGDAFNAAYSIEAFPLSKDILQLNQNGLTIGIADGIMKSADAFSHIKSCNSLAYALAARFAKARQWNDALLLNQHGNIADSTIANIFWSVGDKIFTPPLSEGGVAGIMRRHLLHTLPQHGLQVTEQAADTQIIEEASTIFLTNAIRGIRWVKDCSGHKKTCGIAAELHQILLRTF